jgi:hypothetical protein
VLLIKEDITLPPHSSKICRVQISGRQEPNDFIAEISLPSQPWIQGAPLIIRQKEGNPALIEIFNASLVFRTLMKNTNVGNAEILDLIELCLSMKSTMQHVKLPSRLKHQGDQLHHQKLRERKRKRQVLKTFP